jgi:hypothetical protein
MTEISAIDVYEEKDPYGLDQHNKGAKLDDGKPLPWLFISGFPNVMSQLADLTTMGARKYTPGGWAYVPDGASRYMEAFARHMMAHARGEEIDPDTGCLHKLQMIWNLMASLELESRDVR